MKKILIADDEDHICEALKYIIEKETEVKIVKICSNGIDAIEQISKFRPDIVFLDIEMPGMGGIECAKKINKIPNAPKIVFSTGFEQFAIQAFELEAFDYILKPYVDERIYKTVKRFFDYEIQNKNSNSNNSSIYKKNKIK